MIRDLEGPRINRLNEGWIVHHPNTFAKSAPGNKRMRYGTHHDQHRCARKAPEGREVGEGLDQRGGRGEGACRR